MTAPYSFYRPKRLQLPGQNPPPADMFTLNHDALDRADATSAQADQINAYEQGPTPQEPAPRLSLGQRLVKSLPDAVGYGLSTIDPEARGAEAFLGGLGRGYVGQQDRARADQQDAQHQSAIEQQQALERQRYAMQMRGQLMGQANDSARLSLDQQRLGIDRTRAAADQARAERPVAGEIPDWRKEDFPSQPAWMKYHERISRAGGGGAQERGQVTPAARFQERTRLMAPHWGANPMTGAMEMQPGVSAAEAARIVGEAENGPGPAPVATGAPNPWSGRGMGSGTGGMAPRFQMPQAPASGGAMVHDAGASPRPAANSGPGRAQDTPDAADLERAKTDPGFAAWLKKNGYAVP